MKTYTSSWRYTMAMFLLFMVAGGCYAQKSKSQLAVSKTWQQRMDKAIPDMKEEYTLQFNAGMWDSSPIFRKTGLTKEEWPTLITWPVANFFLDNTAFMNLQQESKIEELVRLDTTYVTYLCFSNKKNTKGIKVSGTLRYGVWTRQSMEGLGNYSDTVKLFYRKKIPMYQLRIEIVTAERPRTLLIFKENGRFMAYLPIAGRSLPLMDILMDYQANVKNNRLF